jgi:hypothetical protein
MLIIEIGFNSNTYVKRKCKPEHKQYIVTFGVTNNNMFWI